MKAEVTIYRTQAATVIIDLDDLATAEEDDIQAAVDDILDTEGDKLDWLTLKGVEVCDDLCPV
jgi:hypothetical protein